MTRNRPLSAALVAALLLSACASLETRPEGAWLSERQAWFAARPDWSVEGRLGLSDGERGGSLAMRWKADGDVHRVRLRTLVGGRQWLLRIEPGYAVLTGSEVGRIEGPDPDVLVERAVGWPIPVRHMSQWLRGLPAPPEARVEFAETGALTALAWRDWRLAFRRWTPPGEHGVLLPARVDAVRPPHEVRAALRNWRFGSSIESREIH